MIRPLSRAPASAPLRRSLAVALVGLAAAACAPLPPLSQSQALKDPTQYATRQAFDAAAAPWPTDRWWAAYGDAQLDALIDEALRDAPDMAAAAARLAQAEAFGAVARSALGPQVSASASVSEEKLSYNNIIAKEFTPKGWNDYGRVAVDLGWELDFWGKNRAALAAALSQADAARAEAADVRRNIAAAVAATYADFARLYVVRDTLVRAVDIRRKSVALFDERFRNQLETQGSLSEAQARLAAVEGELLALDEDIGLVRHRLAALVGAGPDRGRALARPQVNLAQSFGLPTQLSLDLLGRRPDVVAARSVVEAQGQRIAQAKAEFYPNVNLRAFIGVQSLGLDMLGKSGSDIGGIGPAVSLPIFTAGRLQGNLRAVSAGYDQAVASYNRTVTQALNEVADATLSHQALDARLGKAREAVDAAARSHQVATNRYAGGLATYLEVLYAEDGLLNAQRTLATLQSRAFSLDVSLKRALGGGYQVLASQQ
ncbi:MAG: efflux transporter outer membrane subunit [Rhodocyclaceae bacterium]